jgi:hypothetical protein
MFSFNSTNWNKWKVILYVGTIISIIIACYFLLSTDDYMYPKADLSLYNNQVYIIKDNTLNYTPTEIPYRKYKPFTLQFWMKFYLDSNVNIDMNKGKPQCLFYLGEIDNNKSISNSNILLLQSIKLDNTVQNEKTLGYQMVYETQINNMYINNNTNRNIYFKIGEWSQYSFVFMTNSIHIYINGEFIESYIFTLPNTDIVNKTYLSYIIPGNYRDEFDNTTKEIFNINWYNRVINKDDIYSLYLREKKLLDKIIEPNMDNIIKECDII